MFDYFYYRWNLGGLENFLESEVGGALALGSLILAFVIYFAFLSRRNSDHYTGFMGWLYEFLNFNRLVMEGIFKILYLLITFFYIAMHLYLMLHYGTDIKYLLRLVVGVVVIRVSYEFILMVIMLCRNVSDINRKMKMDQNSYPDNSRRNYNAGSPTMNAGSSTTNTGSTTMNAGPPTMNASSSTMNPGFPTMKAESTMMNAGSPNMNRNINGSVQNGSAKQMESQFVQQNASFDSQPSSVPTQPQQTSSQQSKADPLPVIQNVKYCNVCGNVLEADDSFCANCGSRVD